MAVACRGCRAVLDSVPQVCPYCKATEFEEIRGSRIYHGAAGQSLIELRKAKKFIRDLQEKEYQERKEEMEQNFPARMEAYAKELEDFRNWEKRRQDLICQVNGGCATIFFLSLAGAVAFFFWAASWKYRWVGAFGCLIVLGFVTGILRNVILHRFFPEKVKRLAAMEQELATLQEMHREEPKKPTPHVPFPSTESDLRRYYEQYPKSPVSLQFFNPETLEKLIQVIESCRAQTPEEAIRVLHEDEYRERVQQENRTLLEETRRLREEQKRTTQKASDAAIFSALNLLNNHLNRR
ncbi:MAG: hypothetical protein Q4D98_09780 [Planctomycetia bacterium]|nr:hypothetical protein [Planctomycetia bacterium]